LKLFTQTWEPEKKIKAVVCLVHGMGDHSSRYVPLADALTKAGYVLMAFDLRGHGHSEGQRGHSPSYDALMDDIQIFLNRVDEKYPGKSKFLYGHSMGGNLVLNYVLLRKPELKGVICTSPQLALVFEPPKWKVALAKIISSLIPALSMTTGLPSTGLSRDKKVVDAYDNDPLTHSKITPRFFVNIDRASKNALKCASKFSLPLLLMHGSADSITSPEASAEFASKIKKDCTFKLWEGFYHELHNEPGKEKVVSFIIKWLNKH